MSNTKYMYMLIFFMFFLTNSFAIEKQKVIKKEFNFEKEYTNILMPIYNLYFDDNKSIEIIKKDLLSLNKIDSKLKLKYIDSIKNKDIQENLKKTILLLKDEDNRINFYIVPIMENKIIKEMNIVFSQEFELYWNYKKVLYIAIISDFLDKNNGKNLKYQLTKKGLIKFQEAFLIAYKYIEYEKIDKNNIKDLIELYKTFNIWEYYKN